MTRHLGVSAVLFCFLPCYYAFANTEGLRAPLIAVLDSGIDDKYGALAGHLIPGRDFTGKGSALVDQVGHGTAMAGLVLFGAEGLQGCGGCRLMPVRVTNGPQVNLTLLARAVRWASDEGADVILTAMGAPVSTPELAEAIEYAANAGVSVVAPIASSGSVQPLFPGSFRSVVSVAALSWAGQRLDQAPVGADILIPAFRIALDNQRTVSGGSVAAALAAAQIARGGWHVADSTRARTTYGKALSGPLYARLQYADTDDEDVIIDAPWRTIRDYVPVLIFTAEFDSPKNTLKAVEIRNYNRTTGQDGSLVFADTLDGADQLTCAASPLALPVEIIDPEGRTRGPIDTNEAIRSHWHYIVRIPTACIGVGAGRGQPGTHFLAATVKWSLLQPASSGTTLRDMETRHVLRVVVENDAPLPKFHPSDRHYDIHYHTIAEQTRGGVVDVDSARRAFGGPLAMVVEAAYAIGMVHRPLKDGNWALFRDQIATTDHNVFFSDGQFDSGHSPRFGPTAATDGKTGEFRWYRDNFGTMGGEEVTLKGTGRVITSGPDKRLGSHFLVYGGPHFEGPWHGGEFKAKIDALGILVDHIPGVNDTGAKNPNQLLDVLAAMSKTNGFGYAAHPFSSSIGWPRDYFEQAIGLPPFNEASKRNALVNAKGDDFIYKGSQVWNGKADFVARRQLGGNDLRLSDADDLDPFTPGTSNQLFTSNLDWDRQLLNTMAEYMEQVRDGLTYTFAEQPDHRFSRKIYMSAGTDAHGDFNHEVHNAGSTAEAEASDFLIVSEDKLSLSSNAFARVRTYTLSGDRDFGPGSEIPPPFTAGNAPNNNTLSGGNASTSGPDPNVRIAVEAYRDGNTVLTDGPICMFHLDTNCRFNSAPDKLEWEDGSCRFLNRDGAIGGIGIFDGGRTALVANEAPDIWIRSIWKGRNDYFHSGEGGPSAMNFETIQIAKETILANNVPSGPDGKHHNQPLSGFRPARLGYNASALILRGTLGQGERRSLCVTNPVWTTPYRISVNLPFQATCPFKPGEFRVSVAFGASMNTFLRAPTCGDNNCVADPNGNLPFFGAQILVKPLNGRGRSAGDTIVLGNRKWFDHNLPGPSFPKVADASLSAVNTETIACPAEDWDAETHSANNDKRSYAIIVKDVVDMHNNRLNPIARSLTVSRFKPPIQHPHSGSGGVFSPIN